MRRIYFYITTTITYIYILNNTEKLNYEYNLRGDDDLRLPLSSTLPTLLLLRCLLRFPVLRDFFFRVGKMAGFAEGEEARKSRSRGSTDPERPFTGGGRFHPIPGVNANLSADSAPRKGDESESERSPALLRVGHQALVVLEDLPVDSDRTISLAVESIVLGTRVSPREC